MCCRDCVRKSPLQARFSIATAGSHSPLLRPSFVCRWKSDFHGVQTRAAGPKSGRRKPTVVTPARLQLTAANTPDDSLPSNCGSAFASASPESRRADTRCSYVRRSFAGGKATFTVYKRVLRNQRAVGVAHRGHREKRQRLGFHACPHGSSSIKSGRRKPTAVGVTHRQRRTSLQRWQSPERLR